MTMHPDGKTLIGLGELAGAINQWFDLDEDDAVLTNTPFVWWHRSEVGKDISLPMPDPELRVGRRRSPAWPQAQLLHWYGEWTEREVPPGPPAGDRIDSKGRVYSGAYRQ